MMGAHPPGRFLRPKKLRAALWYAAQGRCQRCQAPLPEAWHADHVIPWCLHPRTNVHEMQALCPQCNTQKGGEMVRLFQQQFQDVLDQMLSGVLTERDLFCAITPGGGKSVLPVLLTQLIPTMADALCWVVPRVALTDQAETTFQSPTLRRVFPHAAQIRRSTNDIDPCRGLHGYVTTYYAIDKDPTLHAMEFARKRYILFLDEPHHVKTSFTHHDHAELSWARALQPLIDRAVLRVYASGTFERHDRLPIAFLPYQAAEGGYRLNFPATACTLRYSRKDALQDKAIVPLYFHLTDAKACWTDEYGKHVDIESFDRANTDGPAMLKVALETQFAEQLLRETVRDWQAHQETMPHAKLLVVAPRITIANEYAAFLRRECGLQVLVATSDETETAHKAIQSFKGRGTPTTDVLVTVAMAYEGLDVPEITHIACLTHYRSKPWLEQCFSRACRNAPQKTCGYIFAPDDRMLAQVAEAIQAEQETVVRDREPMDPMAQGAGPTGIVPPPIIPLSSLATSTRAINMTGEALSREEYAQLQKLMALAHIKGVSPMQMKQFLTMHEHAAPTSPDPEDIPPDLTPSEREKRYRKKIDETTKAVDFHYHRGVYGHTNRLLIRVFRKPREEMRLDELQAVWVYLNTHFPMPGMDEAIA